MQPIKPRILAIDDTPGNLFTLGTALVSEFDLEIATSGSQGLAMARKSVPDLILLDIMMPDMDGLETCRRFREDPRLAAVPVIFLTALTGVESEMAGLDLGVADYITKPFNLDIVKLRIRNTLRLVSLNREVRASEERMRFVLEATGDGIWDWQIDIDQISHNEAWCHMLGLDSSFLHHPIATYVERVHPEDLAAVEEALDYSAQGNTKFTVEYRIRHGDGHYLWVSDTGQVVDRDRDGKASRMVGCIKNIDDRRRSEADIQRLAFFDPLTELPNRRLLMDRLQQAIIRNVRNNTRGALLFLDMDHFKQLNDTHGHAMGDAMLIQVAGRLSGCVREQDTVARLGGDEFVVLLEALPADPVAATNSAKMVGEKLLGALNSPYLLGDVIHHSSPSIGLTLFGRDNENIHAILQRADQAMYAAKEGGRNTLRLLVDGERLGAA